MSKRPTFKHRHLDLLNFEYFSGRDHVGHTVFVNFTQLQKMTTYKVHKLNAFHSPFKDLVKQDPKYMHVVWSYVVVKSDDNTCLCPHSACINIHHHNHSVRCIHLFINKKEYAFF